MMLYGAFQVSTPNSEDPDEHGPSSKGSVAKWKNHSKAPSWRCLSHSLHHSLSRHLLEPLLTYLVPLSAKDHKQTGNGSPSKRATVMREMGGTAKLTQRELNTQMRIPAP